MTEGSPTFPPQRRPRHYLPYSGLFVKKTNVKIRTERKEKGEVWTSEKDKKRNLKVCWKPNRGRGGINPSVPTVTLWSSMSDGPKDLPFVVRGRVRYSMRFWQPMREREREREGYMNRREGESNG